MEEKKKPRKTEYAPPDFYLDHKPDLDIASSEELDRVRVDFVMKLQSTFKFDSILELDTWISLNQFRGEIIQRLVFSGILRAYEYDDGYAVFWADVRTVWRALYDNAGGDTAHCCD